MSSAKPGRYVKRPVVVEAVQLDGSPECNVITQMWAAETGMALTPTPDGYLVVETLEGNMLASPGDWLIKGVKDELYPCKPDIFEATYQPAPSRRRRRRRRGRGGRKRATPSQEA
ncbi:hypothetical protein [Actinomyces qiguomingii]|uniref:hypothetical protein n=1 Tax=Actinomyces qiguomingii TaxID=2057800 RepID=UPI0018EC34B3|nr:hypothetical protein [Actinomyces qiguomingii]